MSDITKRLVRQHERTGLEYLREAADEIERLRERIEELEGRINAAGGDNLERNIEMLRDRGAKLTAQDKRIEELAKENKRVNDLAQEWNAELLEERLQKTHEYAETNDMLLERIEELERLHRETVEEINAQDGLFITDAQIDAAWKFVNECGPRVRAPILHALNVFFGIVRCEGCVGKGKWNIDTNCGATGQYLGKTPYVCPDCDGHGWVKKGGGDGMDND